MANFTVTANIESAKPSSSRSDIHSIMVENYRKSLIQHCERSELRLHFGKTNDPLGQVFLKLEACSQTVLPERSKIGEKNQNSHSDFFMV